MVPNPKEKRVKTSSRNSTNGIASQKKQLDAYIPQYMKEFVHPHQGDFCYTQHFHKGLIAQLMLEGFLPIACENNICLPKLHRRRCVVSLNNNSNESSLHISKSVRKKAQRYHLTINTDFPATVAACRQQHGEHCWLYPPLVQCFEHLLLHGHTGRTANGKEVPVRLFSIQVYNTATGALAAGELGYTVGQWYTSLTGFTNESGAGSVQLAALGRLLTRCGFGTWDLGMDMPYKRQLGSHVMERAAWVQHVHRLRETDTVLAVSPTNCRALIDMITTDSTLHATTTTIAAETEV